MREPSTLKNPLQLLSAVEMALLFQVVLFAVYYVRAVGRRCGTAGERIRARPDRRRRADAVDDAQRVDRHCDRSACRAITMGIVANSIMKAGIAVAVGTRRFRWQAGVALIAMAAAAVGALVMF